MEEQRSPNKKLKIKVEKNSSLESTDDTKLTTPSCNRAVQYTSTTVEMVDLDKIHRRLVILVEDCMSPEFQLPSSLVWNKQCKVKTKKIKSNIGHSESTTSKPINIKSKTQESISADLTTNLSTQSKEFEYQLPPQIIETEEIETIDQYDDSQPSCSGYQKVSRNEDNITEEYDLNLPSTSGDNRGWNSKRTGHDYNIYRPSHCNYTDSSGSESHKSLPSLDSHTSLPSLELDTEDKTESHRHEMETCSNDNEDKLSLTQPLPIREKAELSSSDETEREDIKRLIDENVSSVAETVRVTQEGSFHQTVLVEEEKYSSDNGNNNEPTSSSGNLEESQLSAPSSSTSGSSRKQLKDTCSQPDYFTLGSERDTSAPSQSVFQDVELTESSIASRSSQNVESPTYNLRNTEERRKQRERIGVRKS